MNRMDLEGRAAIVTGAAAGVGNAIAQRFAASGAAVAFWDVNEAAAWAAASALGPGHFGIGVDVADEAAVEGASEATAAHFGKVDILVCSAGITGPNTTTWDYPTEAWRKVFDVNVHGLFYCNRAVVSRMLKKDYGRIVNVASIAGKEGNPNASAYSASKAAVISQGTRTVWNPGQLCHAGGCENGDVRPDDGRTC